jgi:hypothetical protein
MSDLQDSSIGSEHTHTATANQAGLAKTRTQRLAEVLLRDRADRVARKAGRAGNAVKIERVEFDPFQPARWRVVAGGDPGYLVTAPMSAAPLGYVIDDDDNVVGFTLARGKLGVEGFDREQRSLGLFPTAAAAARMVLDAAANERGGG